MKHTPGPWIARESDTPGRFYVETEAAPHKTITGWGSVRQLEPDAKLIAAAPTLLGACEEALATLEHHQADIWPLSSDMPVVIRLREAIAKARGG